MQKVSELSLSQSLVHGLHKALYVYTLRVWYTLSGPKQTVIAMWPCKKVIKRSFADKMFHYLYVAWLSIATERS